MTQATGPNQHPSRARKLPKCEFSQMWPQRAALGDIKDGPRVKRPWGTLRLSPLRNLPGPLLAGALCSLAGKTLFKLLTPSHLTLHPSCVRQACVCSGDGARALWWDLGGAVGEADACPPRPASQGQTCEQAVTLASEN